jgi:hypothetical protein
MNESPQQQSSSGSLGRTVVAALILIVVGWFLLGFIGHIVSFLFSTIVFVLLVVAFIWALRVIL